MAIAVAASLVVLPGTVAPAAAADPCNDVALVGVKGSGEDQNKRSGVGETVGTAWDMVKNSATDLGYAFVPVHYPAESTSILIPNMGQISKLGALPVGVIGPVVAAGAIGDWYTKKAKVFMKSIDAGVGSLVTAIDLRSRLCPDESLVLVGYSQGAAAIHRYLNRLEDEENWDVMDRIAAVILIADPDRVPNSSAQSFGSADRGAQGVAAYLASLKFPQPRRDIPSDLSDITVSVCMKGDMICDFTLKRLAGASKAIATHTASYKDKGGANMADAISYVAEFL